MLINYQHQLSLFSRSSAHHWRISLRMNTFASVGWFPHVRCRLGFIKMAALKNFYHHHHIPQCMIIDWHPTSFLCSWRWGHWRVSLIIFTLGNVGSFTNIRCHFYFHPDEIIEEFLSSSSHCPMFDHWPASDVFFVFMGIRSVKNFFHHQHVSKCLIVDQHPMFFFSSSRWDHSRVSHRMETFANFWLLSKIRCPFWHIRV